MITLRAIDDCLSHVSYNPETLKHKLIWAIRSYYISEEDVTNIEQIPAEDLITKLWDIDNDPAVFKAKRKNLSSLKSSINADLKKNYKEGKNPDGVSIGRNNVFSMSEEVKNELLSALSSTTKKDTATLEKITEALKVIGEIVSEQMGVNSDGETLGKMAQLRSMVGSLLQRMGGEAEGALYPGASANTGHEGKHVDAVDSGSDDSAQSETLKTAPDPAGVNVPFPEGILASERKGPGLGELAGKSGERIASEGAGTEIESAVPEAGSGQAEGIGAEKTSESEELEEAVKEIAETEEELEEVEDVEELEEAEEEDVLEELDSDEAEGTEEDIEEEQEDELPEAAEEAEDVEEVEEVEDTEEIDGVAGIGIAASGIGAYGVGEEPEVAGAEKIAEAEELEEAVEELDETEEEFEEVEDIEELEEAGEEDVFEEPDSDEAEETEEDIEEVQEEEVVEESDETEEIEEAIDEAELEKLDDIEEVSSNEALLPEGSNEEAEDLEIGEAEEELEEIDEDTEIVEEMEASSLSEIGAEAPGSPGQDTLEVDEDQFQELVRAAKSLSQTEFDPDNPSLPSGPDYSGEIPEEYRDIENCKTLAEEFDRLLSVRERYYNQHVFIPGGRYKVGKKCPEKDERTEKLISLEPFYMGRFPVSNALFEVFVEKTGYKTTAEKIGFGTVYFGRYQKVRDFKTGTTRIIRNSGLTCRTVPGACWYQPNGPGTSLFEKRYHPVVQVSFEDAMAFAVWTGKRLPSEDEWEAASRTRKAYLFPWGDNWKKDACNNEDSAAGDTSPVDSFKQSANEPGLMDLIGNVLEWTMDRYDINDGGKEESVYYVAKGGGWISGRVNLSTRFKVNSKTTSNILGFRCVAY